MVSHLTIGRHSISDIVCNIVELGGLLITFALYLIPASLNAQGLSFSLSEQNVTSGQSVSIINESDDLPDGYHYSFNIENCAFYYNNGIVCNLQTTDPDIIFEGVFWTTGTFTITLYGISDDGDTLERSHDEIITITAITLTSARDSCADSTAFSCVNDNLVCNGSFEWNSYTIYYLDQLVVAAPWRDLIPTCDLFSEVNTGSWGYWVNIPDNLFGSQYAHTGISYIGLGGDLSPANPNFEIATSPLKATLKKGQRYGVEYFTSKADYHPYSSSGVQVFFSIDELQPASWSNLKSLINPNWIVDNLGDSIITDTVNWVRFYDVFIPDTNVLSWVSLGQVRDTQDINTYFDPNIPDPYNGYIYPYYYYDDISIRPLPPLVSLLEDTVCIQPCDTAVLKVVGAGAGSYLWSTSATSDSIKVSPWANTTYSVTITDPEGCNDTVLYGYVCILNPVNSVKGILGHNNNCDSVSTYSVDGGNSNYTYEWNISSNHGVFPLNNAQTLTQTGQSPVQVVWTNIPALPAYALLTVTEYNLCNQPLGTDTIQVFACCGGVEEYILNNDTISDTTFYYSGLPYWINGELVIVAQTHVLFNFTPGGTINMGPMAKITIMNPGVELRFNNCTIKQGCNYMWDGIYVHDSTSGIHADSSSFMDAINAIVSDSGAWIDIRNSNFVDNYRSIVMQNFPKSYKPSIDSSGHYWPLQIYGTEFHQTGFSTQTLPYPPMDGSYACSAIELHNVDSVIIGKLDTASNKFYDLSQAIISHNSCAEIINNEFSNIYIPPIWAEIYPPRGAVEVYKSGTLNIPVANTRIGNGYASGMNKFVSCRSAITFYNNQVRIENNEFTDCTYAIDGINLVGTTRIYMNNMDQTSSTGLSGDVAITLAEANPNYRSITLEVDTNYIRGYQKGIWATNLSKSSPGKVQFSGNTILFNILASGVSGIKADNCDGALISLNNIGCVARPDSTFTPGSHNGIWVNATGAASVKSNNLLRMGQGIYTTGQDVLTYFICNNLDSCFHGFFFGPSTSLSDQGISDTFNTLNRWIGNYSGNGCTYWRRMMQDTGNITNTYLRWHYPGLNSIYDPGSEHCNNHPLNICIDEILNDGAQTDCAIDSTVYDPFDISSAGERESLLGDIVRQQNTYTALQPAYLEEEKDLFYQIVSSNPGILIMGDSSDATYQDFYWKVNSTPTGTKHQVFSLMEAGQFIQAAALNATMADTTEWDRVRKQVNRIYLDSWCKGTFSFLEEDKDTLISFAYSSPYEKGDGVFTARVLLGIDPDKVPLPQRIEIQSNKAQETFLIFYPNPATSMLFFKIEKQIITDEQPAILELYDVYGRIVQSTVFQIQQGDNCIYLSTIIKPGLYFIRLKTRQSLLGTGKVIIR